MRKLVLILIASIAALTFIRAFDDTVIRYDELHTGETIQVIVE